MKVTNLSGNDEITRTVRVEEGMYSVDIHYNERLDSPMISSREVAKCLESTKERFRSVLNMVANTKDYNIHHAIMLDDFLFSTLFSTSYPFTYNPFCLWLVHRALPEYYFRVHGIKPSHPLLNPASI